MKPAAATLGQVSGRRSPLDRQIRVWRPSGTKEGKFEKISGITELEWTDESTFSYCGLYWRGFQVPPLASIFSDWLASQFPPAIAQLDLKNRPRLNRWSPPAPP